MSLSLLQPCFFMSKTRGYAQILIGSRLFLTGMAIHLCLLVAPLDLHTRWKFSYSICTCSCSLDEYSCLYRYDYKHFLIPINKTTPFYSLFRNQYRNECFLYVVYLSDWGVSGKTFVGHLLGMDAHLTSVFISFIIFLCALRFQKLPVESASISIHVGPIDILIIKFSINGWNTYHQPGSISGSGTSIHVPMPFQSCLTLLTSPSQPVSCSFWKHIFLFHLFPNLLRRNTKT